VITSDILLYSWDSSVFKGRELFKEECHCNGYFIILTTTCENSENCNFAVQRVDRNQNTLTTGRFPVGKPQPTFHFLGLSCMWNLSVQSGITTKILRSKRIVRSEERRPLAVFISHSSSSETGQFVLKY
jgi:hypothetical protein